jgi:hypothetical protein
MLPYGDAALKYFESQEALNGVKKATYRSIASYMTELCEYKGDTAKAAEYTRKRTDPRMN